MRRKGCCYFCFTPAVTAPCRTLDSVSAAPSSESALDAVHIGIFARLVTRKITSSLMRFVVAALRPFLPDGVRKVCSGPLLLPYSRELELRTVGLLQDHV